MNGQHATSRSARAAVLRAGAVLVATVAAVVTLAAPAAGAHGDDATASLVSATPSGTTSVITVKLTYTNDDEAVTDATVTVAGDDGAGATLTPVNMQPGPTPGEFTATVDFPAPGTWQLRVTSIDPAATLSLTQEIASDPQVTTEQAGGGATSSTASTTTTTSSGGGVPSLDSGTAPASSDDDGISPVWWIVGGIAVLLAVGLGVLFVVRGRDQGPID